LFSVYLNQERAQLTIRRALAEIRLPVLAFLEALDVNVIQNQVAESGSMKGPTLLFPLLWR
jgi:hypothetical protein